MLTQYRPEQKPVGNTDEIDLYVKPGDGIGYRHMCPWSARRIFGVELEPMQAVRVWLQGGKLEKKGKAPE